MLWQLADLHADASGKQYWTLRWAEAVAVVMTR